MISCRADEQPEDTKHIYLTFVIYLSYIGSKEFKFWDIMKMNRLAGSVKVLAINIIMLG